MARFNRLQPLAAATLVTTLLSISVPASATVVVTTPAAAQYTWQASADGNSTHSLTAPGSVIFSGPSHSVTYTFDGTPAPKLTVHEVASVGSSSNINRANLKYFYHIEGIVPANGTVAGTLSVILSNTGGGVDWSSDTFVTGTNFAGAHACATSSQFILVCPSSIPSALSSTFNINFPADGFVNLLDTVQAIPGSAPAFADAFIDPVITLPAGFTITFSDGIGNSFGSVPAPEPASIVIMLTGLAGLRMARRRARSAADIIG